MASLHQPAPQPPNPQPIAFPAPPNDPKVQLPPAPVFPPSENDVLRARRYCLHVDISIAQGPLDSRCTPTDRHNALLYEHAILTQAAAVANPQGTTSPNAPTRKLGGCDPRLNFRIYSWGSWSVSRTWLCNAQI